jgi:hypothetical protein
MYEVIELTLPINVNGRIYTKEDVEPCVEELIKRIKDIGCLYGEFNPVTMSISLSKCSHTINDIWFDKNVLMCKIRILNTYWGKQVRELVKNNIELTISPRSIDSIDSDGIFRLKKIYTFDIIYDIKKIREKKLNNIKNSQDLDKETLPIFEIDLPGFEIGVPMCDTIEDYFIPKREKNKTGVDSLFKNNVNIIYLNE